MPGPTATQLTLTPEMRASLNDLLARRSTGAGLLQRAGIVLLSADGISNAEIGRRLGTTTKTAARWRDRFAEQPALKTLKDRHRSGRPAQVPPETRAKLISLACERPEKDKTPFRVVWTRRALQEALLSATGIKLSVSEIGRILGAEELRPHLVRMWLHSQDPDFDAKVGRVCDLYVNPPSDATVVCIDEKRLFARTRPFGLQPAQPGKPGRVDFEYKRHGSSVLLAAFNTQTGEVIGDCRPQRKGSDLVEFMEQVADRIPGRVVVIWDNLNVHYDGKDRRWTDFNQRHGGRFEFVYTPKHASWTNQVEIWFSILHRRVLQHASFATVDAVNAETLGFIDHWNTHEAHPFRWTFRGTTKRHHRGFERRDARTPDRPLDRSRARSAAA